MSRNKTYVMTRQQRRDAIVALKACKPYLSHGPTSPRTQATAICVAINIAQGQKNCTADQDEAATNLIDRSLGQCPFYTSWLLRNVHPLPTGHDEFFAFVQKQRHRWVDHLIQSLERSLK